VRVREREREREAIEFMATIFSPRKKKRVSCCKEKEREYFRPQKIPTSEPSFPKEKGKFSLLFLFLLNYDQIKV